MLIFALVGIVLVLLSFATWSRPSTLGLQPTPNAYITARAIALGLWTLALPAYSLWEWYFSLNQQLPNPAGNFQYGHQVWSSVWAAVAGLLGVLFAIRR
jgi:hypothetical protein